MNKEEKKAIEELEKFINKYEPFVFYSKQKGDTADINPHIKQYETYKTVLNLIEKQDKIIDLMAKEYVCKGKKNTSCNIYITKKYSSCKECVKEKFRKKVEDESI